MLKNVNPVFITNILFFDSFSAKHKPIFVNGRDFYSLTYRHSGKISITCGDSELISGADCVTFVPKGVSYTTEVLEDVHMTAIHFDFGGAQVPSLPVVIAAKGSALRSLFLELMKKGDERGDDLARMSIFYKILAELKRMDATLANREIPERIANAKQLIEECFSNSLFSIEGLAARLGVSAAYLRRAFRAAYGISPVKYLKELRITHAKQLLLAGKHSVLEVAQRCGYTSASYFVQDFHKSVGQSPNQYRNGLCATP